MITQASQSRISVVAKFQQWTTDVCQVMTCWHSSDVAIQYAFS